MVEGPSMCVCLGSVSWLRLGLGNWGGRPQRQSATVLTSYRGHRLTTRLTIVDVDLDCMAGFMSAAFLCCQDTFPVSPLCSSEGSSSEGAGSSAPTHLRGEQLMNYLGFCAGHLSLLCHFLISIPMDSWIFICYLGI